MVAEPNRRANTASRRSGGAVGAFAATSRAVAEGSSLRDALRAVADAAAAATRADVAIARVLDADGGCLTACAVSAASAALRAELDGSRYARDELPSDEVDDVTLMPAAVRRAALRAHAESTLLLPVSGPGGAVGSLELMRGREPFDAEERALARIAALEAGLAIRAFSVDEGRRGRLEPEGALALAGDALAAGSDSTQTAEQVTRLAAEATGARASLLWRGPRGSTPELVASFALTEATPGLAAAAERALRARAPVTLERDIDLPAGAALSATLQLGQPAIGVLQLLYAREDTPAETTLAKLATFGVRAAHALRSSARSRTVAMELERTRVLLAVVGQAIAQLSLAHTLETAVQRIAELLGTDAVAVYLREDGRLTAAAGRGLVGPHVRVAERLLELALGPFRGRGMVYVDAAAADSRLGGVEEAVAEAGIEAAAVVPLLVHDEVIGLLAVYPPKGRRLTENEATLLLSLGSQLAVAVQNAQLHEQVEAARERLENSLSSEQASARHLRALYEISRSFAQSLSLDRTLDAVARTIVELLDVDAAVIRIPDPRRESLVPAALHVADARLDNPIGAILSRPASMTTLATKRLYRLREPLVLDPETARELGPPHSLLVPFLEKGSTAVIVPIATPTEVLATLKMLSLDPDRPITEETTAIALSIAAQAALAVDNARLYQQQKEFSDAMQRSLLPRSQPELAGLDLGAVYESSARVDVGGDVYDFLELDDGRLAVVLGDVTGHGIDAAADMAMAKFVFRSLAREHSEPGAFLAAANEVVVGEIAPGKFITMSYVTIDAERGEVACACGGHPAPRVVAADGTVTPLDASGLVLGVDGGQTYEEVRAAIAPGAAVVLYTDGVVEARNEGELYGFERLDALLRDRHALSATELAEAVVDDCREFGGGELVDDCAVVVIKRTG